MTRRKLVTMFVTAVWAGWIALPAMAQNAAPAAPAAAATSAAAPAAPNEFTRQTTGWTRMHSLVLLPIVNQTDVSGNAIVAYTTGVIKTAMRQSPMIELAVIHKQNPSIRRATSGTDPVLTQAEVDAAINEPTLENVLTVAAACGIDNVVKITIDSYVRPVKPDDKLTVQLTGTLYTVGTGEVAREVKVVDESVSKATVATLEQLRDEAFHRAAADLVQGFIGPLKAAAPQPAVAPPPPQSAPAATHAVPTTAATEGPPAVQGPAASAPAHAAAKPAAPPAPDKSPSKTLQAFVLGLAALLVAF